MEHDRFAYDVFLSHDDKDKPAMRQLAERLRRDRLRVWFDEWVIRPGDDIYLSIEDGLQTSRVLVLAMSGNAFASGWVGLERSTSLFRDPGNRERRFVPLLLANCDLPDALKRYRYIDFSDQSERAYQQLLEACQPASSPSELEGGVSRSTDGHETQASSSIELDALIERRESRREAHCHEVIDNITSKLKDLGAEIHKRVARSFHELGGGYASGINPNDEVSRMSQTATYMVHHCAVTDAMALLIDLMLDMENRTDTHRIADIIDDLLPLNYVPDIVRDLREQIEAHQFGLVENEVATWTLAEIIVAGYDQRPAAFQVMTDGGVRGRTAIDYDHGPEVGPGDRASEMLDLLPAVRDVLHHLLARLDAVPPFGRQVDLRRQVEGYAIHLQGVLRAERRLQKQRSLYYVLKLPGETPEPEWRKREFLKRVIREVGQRVPQLVFVELSPYQKDARESEVDRYIQRIQKDFRFRVVRRGEGPSC